MTENSQYPSARTETPVDQTNTPLWTPTNPGATNDRDLTDAADILRIHQDSKVIKWTPMGLQTGTSGTPGRADAVGIDVHAYRTIGVDLFLDNKNYTWTGGATVAVGVMKEVVDNLGNHQVWLPLLTSGTLAAPTSGTQSFYHFDVGEDMVTAVASTVIYNGLTTNLQAQQAVLGPSANVFWIVTGGSVYFSVSVTGD
jgi:hypothetical protein